MSKGKWIFLVNKLSTEVAPPAMSIHYAVPWPMKLPNSWEKKFDKQARNLRELLSECDLIDKELLDETKDEDLWDFLDNDEIYNFVADYDDSLLDKITNEISFWDINSEIERKQKAMQIKFAGENIRVFPEEFSEVSLENMKEYLKIFTFHPINEWSCLAVKPTDPDEKFIFEACLLDGCDEYQATNIVNGGNIDSVDDFPAPLGWYECPIEYGLYFGKSEDDMKARLKNEVVT